jgi:hypothetical protein
MAGARHVQQYHDHHPLTLIRQRSHHVVACSFEVSVSVTREMGAAAPRAVRRALFMIIYTSREEESGTFKISFTAAREAF